MKILVIGCWACGKTTLINALLGGEYLGWDNSGGEYLSWGHSGSYINVIKYAQEKKAVLHFENSLPEIIPEGISQKVLTHMQKYKMGNVPPMDVPYEKIEECIDMSTFNREYIYQKVEFFAPLDILKGDVSIAETTFPYCLDGVTPPLLFDIKMKSFEEYAAKADTVIYCMNAPNPCSQEELYQLSWLNDRGIKPIICFTKFDMIPDNKIRHFAGYIVERCMKYASHIFFVDAPGMVDALGMIEGDENKRDVSGYIMLKYTLGLADSE